MTFRDDHEAAVQRADALERELDQTKDERDRLQAEVEQMRQAALAPPQQEPEAQQPAFDPYVVPPQKATWLIPPVIVIAILLIAGVHPFVGAVVFALAIAWYAHKRKHAKRTKR